MERLTARREDGKAIYACSLRWEAEDEQSILDRLAELEDKLESGQALELPFKVGDKVYLVRRNRNWDLVVSRTKIEMYLYHNRLLVKCACDSSWHEPKELFADKKEAEARLKELLKKD